MLTAIEEIADTREDEKGKQMATYNYLKACNLLFEEGILSEEPITSIAQINSAK